MSGSKKHPLEIYRTAPGLKPDGGTGDSAPAAGPPPRPGMTTGLPPSRASGPVREFELHLSLVGAVILLFAWVVLMGGAYLVGYRNGESAANDAVAGAARSKGQEIERGIEPADGAPSDEPAASLPYGVRIATYGANQTELINEVRDVLGSQYAIGQYTPYLYREAVPSTNQVELFAGMADRADDPTLLKLLDVLRNIDDYPKGNDKQPFRNARIARFRNPPKTGN